MDRRENMDDHDYDGIRELDNRFPRWWSYLFIATIVWAALYILFYHVFDIGFLSVDEYNRELDPDYIKVKGADEKLLGVFNEYHSPWFRPGEDFTPAMAASGRGIGRFVELTAAGDTVTYIALVDEKAIETGRATFKKNCAQCHGELGEGGIGPNLTDDYWLHGGGMTNVTKSIKYGYPSKGMIAWRGTLNPERILEVASYVLTLRGTNPPNAKAPQGEIYLD